MDLSTVLDARLPFVTAPGALRREDAARYLAISDESFDRYVRPFLQVVRLGTLRVYPLVALDRFLEERASSPVEDVA